MSQFHGIGGKCHNSTRIGGNWRWRCARARLQHDAAVTRGTETGGHSVSVVLDASAVAACAWGGGWSGGDA